MACLNYMKGWMRKIAKVHIDFEAMVNVFACSTTIMIFWRKVDIGKPSEAIGKMEVPHITIFNDS